MKQMVYGLLGLFVVLSTVVGLQFHAIYATRVAGRAQTCAAWRNFDALLKAQIAAGEKTAPSFTYYRQHPDELARAVAADQAFAAKLVPPDYC